MTYRRKLIEVALPLDKINAASEHEKNVHTGLPANLHVWWARKPLSASRAVIFASLVDDPGEVGVPNELLEAIDKLPAPARLPAEWDSMSQADQRRERLFEFIGELVRWENTTNEAVIGKARELIQLATGGNPPPLLDPFCGGGSIPLEGQRLGLDVYASDLNPVAVLITKALVELPPKFAGRPPVNQDERERGHGAAWKGAAGLAADVRWYGKWMRERARERIGHLYPQGPNGETVIAWLWARTVRCPNPACGAQMPLVRSFWLSTNKGKEAWVEPIVDKGTKSVRFAIRKEKGTPPNGTKDQAKIYCLVCAQAVEEQVLRKQATDSGLGTVPFATALDGVAGRTYVDATEESFPSLEAPSAPHLAAELSKNTRWFSPPLYGLRTFAELFTPRQLIALETFSDLIAEVRDLAFHHACEAKGDESDDVAIGRTGAKAYAEAVATYLALAVDRLAQTNNVLIRWLTRKTGPSKGTPAFDRHAVPMAWGFSEGNVLGSSVGSWDAAVKNLLTAFSNLPTGSSAQVLQLDAAQAVPPTNNALIVTDPPYYANVGYAQLSDFFYVWLRRSLQTVYPQLLSTLLTPKEAELLADPYRYAGDKTKAKTEFERGLRAAFEVVRHVTSLGCPIVLYYAFKQTEDDGAEVGTVPVSSGWETLLDGLVGAGLRVGGTWPVRSEAVTRATAIGNNSLASSVVLSCRLRPESASIGTRKDFQSRLREELPRALAKLTGGHIAPVDLAQSAIGPGMAVFSSYAKVVEADGSEMSVRTALGLINEAIEDYFAEQEGAYDPDTQFCVRWFEQHGFTPGSYGDADNLARAKNIGVDALARDGVVEAKGGKVSLRPLAHYVEGVEAYDPLTDRRPTVWEACHYLVAALQSSGEQAAARLARRLGGLADQARDLAYRLYDVCDRKGWAEPALGYNALVASWPEIQKQAAQLSQEQQTELL